MTKVCGNSIFIVKKFIKENHGKHMLDQIIKETDQESQKILSGVIVSNELYDLKVKEDLLEVMSAKLGEGEAIKCSRVQAQEQVKGLFALIPKFLTLDAVLQKMQSMWDKIFSEGKILLKEKKDNHINLEVSGIKLSPLHQIYIYEYIKAVLEEVVKKNCTGEVKQVNDSTYELSYVV